MSASPSRWRLVGLAVIVGLVAGASALEAYARSREDARPFVDMSSPRKWEPHPRLGRAFVRDVTYDGRLRINNFGFRGPDVTLEKPVGTTRIIVTGASGAFDACAARDSESWPARLQAHLEALQPGRRFEVLNAATPVYSMVDNTIRMQTEVYQFAPDIIVLYGGHGAISSTSTPEYMRGPLPPPASAAPLPAHSWLQRHSALYNRVKAILPGRRPMVPELRGEVDWPLVYSRAEGEFRRDLTAFVGVGKAIGAQVVIVELAAMTPVSVDSLSAADSTLWRNIYGVPPAISIDGFRRFSRVQREVAAATGATFVPARDFGIVGREHYCSGDLLHFGQSGADLLGRSLARLLVESTVLRADSAQSPRR